MLLCKNAAHKEGEENIFLAHPSTIPLMIETTILKVARRSQLSPSSAFAPPSLLLVRGLSSGVQTGLVASVAGVAACVVPCCLEVPHLGVACAAVCISSQVSIL